MSLHVLFLLSCLFLLVFISPLRFAARLWEYYIMPPVDYPVNTRENAVKQSGMQKAAVFKVQNLSTLHRHGQTKDENDENDANGRLNWNGRKATKDNCTKYLPAPTPTSSLSLRCQDDAVVLLAADHLQCVLEVLLAGLDRHRLLLVARQVGVDQFDQAVEVLGSDLGGISMGQRCHGAHTDLPIRFAVQSSRRSGRGSRQTARWIRPAPCTSRPHAAPAADTREHACRRGRAILSALVTNERRKTR